MSLNRSSLSARSLIEQVFSSVGLVALCSTISWAGLHWLFWLWLLSSPNTGLLSGVYFRGSKISHKQGFVHTGGKCVTCRDTINSDEINQYCVSPRMDYFEEYITRS